jgi:hypothetical protein
VVEKLLGANTPRTGKPANAKEKITEGSRNTFLCSLAGTMRRQGLGEAKIEEELLAVNERCCDPPLPKNEVRATAKSVSRHEPKVSPPRLIRVEEVDAAPITWLWPSRIPLGKITLLVGDPGTGKSVLSLDVAAKVSTGAPWPGEKRRRKPGSVVILSAEDDPSDTIRPRLDAAGADVSRIHLLSISSLQQGLGDLERALKKIRDVRLVIFDPITAYLDVADSHKNSIIRCLMAPLAELAAKHRVAILCVSHLNKSVASQAIYRAMGSLGFVAVARAVWITAKDRENPSRRLLLPAKNNLSPDPSGLVYQLVGSDKDPKVPIVRWGEKTSVDVNEALGDRPHQDDRGAERKEAIEFLKEFLKVPRLVKDVVVEARNAGLAWRTVRRASEDLGVFKVRKRTRAGLEHYWSLK